MIYLGLSWFAWAVLWFLFFLLLALDRPVAKLTGAVAIIEGIVTAWVFGFLLLWDKIRSSSRPLRGGRGNGPPLRPLPLFRWRTSDSLSARSTLFPSRIPSRASLPVPEPARSPSRNRCPRD